jgi:hypothetical protein
VGLRIKRLKITVKRIAAQSIVIKYRKQELKMKIEE